MLLIICATLTACATPRVDPIVPPQQAAPATITPVTLRDLRGAADVLVFPDIGVLTAVAGANAYAKNCLPDARRVNYPSGFALYRGGDAAYLTVTVASVSQSSALGVGGTGFTPDLKEALAATVQGRPRCAG